VGQLGVDVVVDIPLIDKPQSSESRDGEADRRGISMLTERSATSEIGFLGGR